MGFVRLRQATADIIASVTHLAVARARSSVSGGGWRRGWDSSQVATSAEGASRAMPYKPARDRQRLNAERGSWRRGWDSNPRSPFRYKKIREPPCHARQICRGMPWHLARAGTRINCGEDCRLATPRFTIGVIPEDVPRRSSGEWTGGHGRRTSLRGWRGQPRGGSNPLFRTIESTEGPSWAFARPARQVVN